MTMFLAFEGIDGSGKTTLSTAVADQLRARGTEVLLFHKKSIPVEAHPYVQRHLAALARLIWDDADDQPIHQLGDAHWVRLMAAYFAAVSDAVVRPALRAGAVVVTDNWYYKFFARMTINTGLSWPDFETVFGAVGRPTRVCYLEVDPAAVAARKLDFTLGETGRHQRDAAAAAGFVQYQSKVATVYRELANRHHWQIVEPGGRTPAELAAELVGRLGEPPGRDRR